MSVQTRQPVGVPIGGQFATTARTEAVVDLAPAQPADTDARTQPVYDMPAYRLDQAIAKIDAANKKLERNGIDDHFTYDVEHYLYEGTTTERGYTESFTEARCKLTLSEPEIAYGGWHFVAALDATDNGVIARTAPGQSLDGWRPDEQSCDHCGTRRQRNSTYVVANADGNRKQIGSDCLEPFLGVRPKGLWALGYDLEDDLKTGDDEFDWGPGSHGTTAVPVRDLIATALAVSDGGKQFLSKARAEEWERTSTSAATNEVLFGRAYDRKDAERRDEIHQRAQQYLEDGTADAVVAAGQTVDGDGDYPVNLRTALAGEWVDSRHSGIAVSAIAMWRRGQERAAVKAAVAPGFIAPEKAKIAGVKATVTKVSYVDDPYGYHGGVNTLVIFQTPDGHQLKWFASGRKDFEVGQAGTFTGGSVKAHEQYKGADQTVVTRVKFAEDAAA